jgi:hypothetical protein
MMIADCRLLIADCRMQIETFPQISNPQSAISKAAIFHRMTEKGRAKGVIHEQLI